MRKIKGLLAISMVSLCMLSVNAQSLSSLSDSELEAKKKGAIASENYDLANKIKAEQNARKSIEDKLKEKNEELKTAIANEDFEKAELLKKEIAQLERDKAKLVELEEDKKIAIFEERYDDVIAIEEHIKNLKSGKREDSNAKKNVKNDGSDELIEQLTQMTPKDFAKARRENQKKEYLKKAESHKQDLKTKPYNEKIIGTFNMGFRNGTYDEGGYEYETTVLAYHISNSRWWLNKYLAGGTFFNFGFPEEGTFDGGAHITGFADFDSPILPYTALGFGMGIDINTGDFYTPIILRIGSNIFFNKHRSLGLSFEYNQYFNNEFMPKFRLGLVWTRMKRKHNTWIQNKK